MRTSLLITLLCLPAFAGSRTQVECSLDRDPDDVVEKGRNVTIEPGQTVKDVVVIDGNVRIKKGASVKTVLVSNGTITLEAGATVRESVVDIGGTPKIDPKAVVKGSRIVIDDGIHIQGDAGSQLDVNLQIGGESLEKNIIAEVLKELRGCKVVDKPAPN